jgi:hypothetical protein
MPARMRKGGEDVKKGYFLSKDLENHGRRRKLHL